MPPVRLRQSKLSNKQIQSQRTSPARGRGRRRARTFQHDEATTSLDTVNVSSSIMPTQIEERQQPPQQADSSEPYWKMIGQQASPKIAHCKETVTPAVLTCDNKV